MTARLSSICPSHPEGTIPDKQRHAYFQRPLLVRPSALPWCCWLTGLMGVSPTCPPRPWSRAGKGQAGPGPAGSGWAEGLEYTVDGEKKGGAHSDGPTVDRKPQLPVRVFSRTVLCGEILKTTNKLVVRCLFFLQRGPKRLSEFHFSKIRKAFDLRK